MSIPQNSRFTPLGDGQYSELVATQVQMFYNPGTTSARANFVGKPFIFLGGKYHPIGEGMDILEVNLEGRMTEIPAKPGDIDPVTGFALDNVSVMGVLGILKRFYDTEHNANAARIAAAIEAAMEEARLAAEAAGLDGELAAAQAAAEMANQLNNQTQINDLEADAGY